jgi:hypothetical protein
VSITGTNFTNGTTKVTFGSTQETNFTVNSPTLILIPAPAGTAGVVDDITVTTAAGTSATSSADHYTYAGVPTVTGVSPAAGALAGGETVTITGSNFLQRELNHVRLDRGDQLHGQLSHVHFHPGSVFRNRRVERRHPG